MTVPNPRGRRDSNGKTVDPRHAHAPGLPAELQKILAKALASGYGKKS
ncbi:hypothetical protein [Mycolicibacterium grossiae]|nr:hypothetical protein [Mycolicibacterium grossiae]